MKLSTVIFELMKEEKFDGMIITGAPVEHLDYEEVNYWMKSRKFRLGTHPCHFHPLHLLGCASRIIPLLRRTQIQVGPEDVRRFQAISVGSHATDIPRFR